MQQSWQVQRYEYTVVEPTGTNLLYVFSTDGQLVSWLHSEAHRRFQVESALVYEDMESDRFALRLELKWDSGQYTQGKEFRWWFFKRLCERGWEPLGNREFRLKKQGPNRQGAQRLAD